MSWKQRIYDLLLPLPKEAAAPPASAFSDAARVRRLEEEKARHILNMEIERRRGVVGA